MKLVKFGWHCVATAAALFLASSSEAGVLSIDFDLSQSSLVAITGSPVSGSQQVKGSSISLVLGGVDANGMLTEAPGAAGSISNFRLTTMIVFLRGDTDLVTSTFDFIQSAERSGTFDGRQIALLDRGISGNLRLVSSCSGPGCSTGFFFPEGINFPFESSGVLAFSLTGLGQPGAAQLSSRTTFQSAGQPLDLQIRGHEVARRFVDEPPLQELAALSALALLSALAMLRRRAA